MAKPIAKNMVDYWMLKSPLLLKQKMDTTLAERIKRGTSSIGDVKDRSLTYKRLALAIAREPNIWNTLVNADLREDKLDKKFKTIR